MINFKTLAIVIAISGSVVLAMPSSSLAMPQAAKIDEASNGNLVHYTRYCRYGDCYGGHQVYGHYNEHYRPNYGYYRPYYGYGYRRYYRPYRGYYRPYGGYYPYGGYGYGYGYGRPGIGLGFGFGF